MVRKLKTLVECKLVVDRFYQTLPGEVHASSQRKQTHTTVGMYWQSTLFTGRNKNKADTHLSFQQAGFERAAQEYKQAARDEVPFAVAQAIEMSGAEMRREEWMLPKIKQSHTWISYQVMLLNDTNSVAGDALKNQRRSFVSEARQRLHRHQRQSHEHLQECQQGVQRHL